MAEAELRNMIMSFRISDLQVLLNFAGRNKTGKKQDLQTRAMQVLNTRSRAVAAKIRELHNLRYSNHQIPLRQPNPYNLADRALAERPVQHYNQILNNSYPPPINHRATPASMHQIPSTSYPAPATKMHLPNVNPNINLMNQYPHHINVRFKDLVFYDTLFTLTRPTGLVSDVQDRNQESTLYFTLSAEQANEITMSKRSNSTYRCQILLRFCVLDVSCEQEDSFPSQCSVYVNSKSVTLPAAIPTNRPGQEAKRPPKPVNITSYARLSPTITNQISINWTSTYGRNYAAGIFISRHLTVDDLLDRLKNNGVMNPEHTTAIIREKLQVGQDADIATTSLCGSLLCPLGKIKMKLPCRSITCNHIQCFDASLYIQMNEKKAKWVCPVCDKPAPYKSLIIDGLFVDISSKVPSDCTEVQFQEDGSWTPVLPKKEKEAKKEEKRAKKPVVEVVDLSDSDTEDIQYKEQSPISAISFESAELPDSPELPEISFTPPVSFSLPPASAFNPVSDSQSGYPYPIIPYPSSLQSASTITQPESDSILPDIVPPNQDALPSVSGLTNNTFPPNQDTLPSVSGLTNSTFPSNQDALPSVSGLTNNSFPDSLDFQQYLPEPNFLPSMSTFANISDVDPVASTSAASYSSTSAASYSSFDFLSLLQNSDNSQESLKQKDLGQRDQTDFNVTIPIE